MTEQKSNKIQVLRGIAIIAVVLIHTSPVGLPSIFIRPFLNFCVGLFLFLSGYLSIAKKWNPKKRIVKIIIPYIIWTIIYVIMQNYRNISIIPKRIIHCLIAADASHMTYYVFVYCQLTLLIPLIDKLAKSKFKYIGFIISPIEVIIMRLLPLIFGITFNSFFARMINLSCVVWFIYFYMGYLIGNNLLKIKKTTKFYVAILIISFAIQICEGYIYYKLGSKDAGTQQKLSAIFTGIISMILVVKFLESEKEYNMKWLKVLGDNSFGIFFSHMAVVMFLYQIPGYTYLVYPFNSFLVVFTAYIFTLIGKKILGNYSKYLAL